MKSAWWTPGFWRIWTSASAPLSLQPMPSSMTAWVVSTWFSSAIFINCHHQKYLADAPAARPLRARALLVWRCARRRRADWARAMPRCLVEWCGGRVTCRAPDRKQPSVSAWSARWRLRLERSRRRFAMRSHRWTAWSKVAGIQIQECRGSCGQQWWYQINKDREFRYSLLTNGEQPCYAAATDKASTAALQAEMCDKNTKIRHVFILKPFRFTNLWPDTQKSHVCEPGGSNTTIETLGIYAIFCHWRLEWKLPWRIMQTNPRTNFCSVEKRALCIRGFGMRTIACLPWCMSSSKMLNGS